MNLKTSKYNENWCICIEAHISTWQPFLLCIWSLLQISRVLKPNYGIFVQLYDLLSWFIFMLMANSGTNGPESIAAAVMARLGPISDKTDKIHREFNFLTKYILNSNSFFFYICLVLLRLTATSAATGLWPIALQEEL